MLQNFSYGLSTLPNCARLGPFDSAQGQARGTPVPTQALVFVPRGGVVAAAGLDFVIPLSGLDLNFAERAVARSVGGHITSVVLAAEFLGNLVEGLAEFFDLVADFDHAASGFLGQLFHLEIAVKAAEAVEAAVGDEQHVADGIGLLRGFDGVLDLQTAALVFSVGEQDHRLAADFVAEFVVRGKIDGVIQRGAARTRRRTRNWTLRANRTAGTTDSPIVDLGLV